MGLTRNLGRWASLVAAIIASLVLLASPASAACTLSSPLIRNYNVAAGSNGYFSSIDFNYGKAEYLSSPAPLGRFSSSTFTTYFYTSAGRWASGPFSSTQLTLRVSHNAGGSRTYRISRACNNPF